MNPAVDIHSSKKKKYYVGTCIKNPLINNLRNLTTEKQQTIEEIYCKVYLYLDIMLIKN